MKLALLFLGLLLSIQAADKPCSTDAELKALKARIEELTVRNLSLQDAINFYEKKAQADQLKLAADKAASDVEAAKKKDEKPSSTSSSSK